ncbi:ATP-binding protein [Aeromicrobium sp. CF4.19]|uniref:sensor histidine kinase n=1 Tax=Aeromicrobium sp. CF4.19 TaxID=3373082 RepID=UPI003EE72469
MPAREAQLDRYAVLSDPPGEDLQDLVDLVADVCDVPTAAINILSRNHQHQVATAGFDASVCRREDSMCALVLDEQAPVVVPDASLDPRFAENAFVTGEIGSVRFYASSPLITPDGFVLGRLCVFDLQPRTLTQGQERALMTLSRQVMDVLELRYRGRELQESLAALTAARDELRRSNEHLAHFAGQVSHDLRNPLTAILTTAEMLAAEPAVEGDTELVAMVEAVGRAGQRMNGMIEEALQLALEGGRLRITDVVLDTVAEAALEDLRPVVDRSAAEVSLVDLPTVEGDPDMLYSVLLNLLANALKFARPEVPPRVSVSAERHAGHWRVRVDDNGRGIAPDRREHVFGLYERAASDVDGHGIGLATTRRLVEAHGGRCGVDDSPLGGVGVWFELPA